MASKEMYALGSQASVIRDLFAYGQQQAAVHEHQPCTMRGRASFGKV